MDISEAIGRAFTFSAERNFGADTSQFPKYEGPGSLFAIVAAYKEAERGGYRRPEESIYDQELPGARRTRKPLYNAEGTPRREVTLDRQMLLGSMGEEQNPAMLLGM